MKKLVTLSVFIISLTIVSFSISAAVLVSKPVINIFAKPQDDSATTSQVIYAAPLKVIKSANQNWLLVKTDDGYQGWVKVSDIINNDAKPTEHSVEVTNLFANIMQEPDTTLHQPILTVPFSTYLPLVQVTDERWLKIRLADNSYGYIQNGDVEIDPQPKTMKQMLATSHKFLGLPYLWSGTSTFGFDCSGFVQAMYRQIGIILPRDGDLQMSWSSVGPVNLDSLQPGDLLYFLRKNKVNHAGIYLGNNLFISSTVYQTPIVQINNLKNSHWAKEFTIEARRLKQS